MATLKASPKRDSFVKTFANEGLQHPTCFINPIDSRTL